MLSSSEPHIVIRSTSNSEKECVVFSQCEKLQVLVMFFRYDVLRVL